MAQQKRWVLIHRLDSDGEPEWEEALSQMSATEELELEHRDDGRVRVRWEESDKTGTPRVGEWEEDSEAEKDPWTGSPETAPF